MPVAELSDEQVGFKPRVELTDEQVGFKPRFADLSSGTSDFFQSPSRLPTDTSAVTGGGPKVKVASAGETFASLAGEAQEMTANLVNRPPIKLGPDLEIKKDDSATVAVGKEAVNLAKGIPEFFTTPQGITAAVTGPVAPVVTSAYFTVDMLHSLGKTVLETYKDWSGMTRAEKAKALTDIGGTALMAASTGTHATKGVLDEVVPARKIAKAINESPLDKAALARTAQVAPLTARALIQTIQSQPEPEGKYSLATEPPKELLEQKKPFEKEVEPTTAEVVAGAPTLQAFSDHLNEFLDSQGIPRNQYSDSDRQNIFEALKTESDERRQEIQTALEQAEGHQALVDMGLAEPVKMPEPAKERLRKKIAELKPTPPPAAKPKEPNAVHTEGTPPVRPVLDTGGKKEGAGEVPADVASKKDDEGGGKAPEEAPVQKPPEKPVDFKTSQGSEYTIDESGNTTRLKKSPGARHGEVHKPHPAVFITPQGHDAIMEEAQANARIILAERNEDGGFTQVRPGHGEDIRGMKDPHVLAVDRKTGEIIVSAQATHIPEVGKHPFEIAYEGENKSYHMGNQIVELGKAPEPSPSEQAVEKITAAAYKDEQGNVHTGPNHPSILEKLGIKGFESAESRNTPSFGFVTDSGRFISREEAGPLVTVSGQNLKEFEPGEPVHSDEVASPTQPDKPLSEVPTLPPTMEGARAVAKMTPAEFAKQKDYNKINLAIGENATPEEVGELKGYRAQAEKEFADAKAAFDPKDEKTTTALSGASNKIQFFNEAIKIAEKKAKPAPVPEPVRQEMDKALEEGKAKEPKETLFDLPKGKGLRGERAQIIRLLEGLEDVDDEGKPSPKPGLTESQEARIKPLRERLAQIEKAIQGELPKPAPKTTPPTEPTKPEPFKPSFEYLTEPMPMPDLNKASSDELRAARDKMQARMELIPGERMALQDQLRRLSTSDENFRPTVEKRMALEEAERKLDEQIKVIGGQLGITRMREETAQYRGKPVVATQKIPAKELKAQKENLMAQLADAIKAAPEENAAKITISVPGDGEFTIENSKDALKRFRDLAQKQMPTTAAPTGKGTTKKAPQGSKPARLGEPDTEDIQKMMGDTVSPDPARFVLNYAYADGEQVVATDGRQLVRIVSDKAPGSVTEPVRIDAQGKVLPKDAEAYQGNYPNFRQVIPKDPDLVMGGADTEQLFHLAKQAEVFRNTGEPDKDKRTASLTIFVNRDKSLGGSMKTRDGDEFKHNIQEGAVSIGNYNPDYILNAVDVARRMGNDKVDLLVDGDTGPLVVRGSNFEHVSMPIRVSDGSAIRDDPKLLSSVAGRGKYRKLPEGYGPLENPESQRTAYREVAGRRLSVSLEGGKLQIKYERNAGYSDSTAKEYKSIGDAIPLAEWPEGEKSQSEAIHKAFASQPEDERLTKSVVNGLVTKIKDAAKEVIGKRQEVLDEIEARKKNKKITPMGFAMPEEFEVSPKTPTSTKNAIVDQERAARGLPPAMQPARKEFGAVWDQAMARIDRDPEGFDQFIDSIRDKPRALTDEENAMLLYRQIDLQNEFGKATRDLAQAYDDGRMDAVAAEKIRVANLSDRLLDIYNIGKKVGTETGRGLAARKMMANEDFSLANLEMTKRADVGGRPLTDEERLAIQNVHDDYQKQLAELNKHIETKDARIAELESKAAHDELLKKTDAEKKASPHVIKIAERIVSELDKKADAARARIRARMGKTFTGVDPTVLLDLAEIGASHIAHIGLDFAKWSAKMVEDLGDWVKPHLEDVFAASQTSIDKLADQMAGVVVSGPVKESVKRVTKHTVESLTDVVVDKLKNGKLDEVTWHVQKLARLFVQKGIRDRDKLIDAVHDVVKKALPNITRRQVMDAISGYGSYKQLAKDQISRELRDLKGQMQQVGKLEDMQAGKAPVKSGVERRTPSDEERRLIKQVNEAKRRGGFRVTDPARQLRSALQTVKTRLQNEISDLQFQIDKKERIVKTKTPVALDPEAEALKAKRDKLKDEFNAIFGLSSDEASLKAYKTRTANRIKELEAKLASGDYTTKPRKQLKMDAEALALKSKVEAVKRRWDVMREKDRLAKRTRTERIGDVISKWRRGFILSSPITLAKLTTAAIARTVITPIEEVAGSVMSRLPGIGQIAERAPRRGGASLHAEIKALTQGVTEGMRDAWDTLRRGHSRLDLVYGGERGLPQSFIEVFGNIHGALKAPVKRMEFARSFQKRAEFYAQQGVDVTDPIVQTKIGLEAYQDAQRAIFMQKNWITKKLSRFINAEIDKQTGHASLGQKSLEVVGNVLLPIRRVPTNIVAEAMEYATGLGTGSVRAGLAFRKGIESLKPEEADLIMRHLQKGSIGAAALLTGFLAPQFFGGFYQHQRQKKGEIKPGGVRIPGVEVPAILGGPDIPSYDVHNPLMNVAQLGATVRKVSESKLHKGDTEAQGLGWGAVAGALGLAEETPFLREAFELGKIQDPNQRHGWADEFAKSLIEPQLMQWIAQNTDTNAEGAPIKRAPKTIEQHLETGIPGLRQEVPAAKNQ